MANITNILEKLWKKINHMTTIFPKERSSLHMIMEYNTIFHILDELQIEEEKTIGIIRKNLFRTRPMIVSRDQLEDYIKRIEFANEIMINLDYLVKKTFDGYISFINTHWQNEQSDMIEPQRSLSEKYDMSMTEWQSILCKIERFNEVIGSFV